MAAAKSCRRPSLASWIAAIFCSSCALSCAEAYSSDNRIAASSRSFSSRAFLLISSSFAACRICCSYSRRAFSSSRIRALISRCSSSCRRASSWTIGIAGADLQGHPCQQNIKRRYTSRALSSSVVQTDVTKQDNYQNKKMPRCTRF